MFRLKASFGQSGSEEGLFARLQRYSAQVGKSNKKEEEDQTEIRIKGREDSKAAIQGDLLEKREAPSEPEIKKDPEAKELKDRKDSKEDHEALEGREHKDTKEALSSLEVVKALIDSQLAKIADRPATAFALTDLEFRELLNNSSKQAFDILNDPTKYRCEMCGMQTDSSFRMDRHLDQHFFRETNRESAFSAKNGSFVSLSSWTTIGSSSSNRARIEQVQSSEKTVEQIVSVKLSAEDIQALGDQERACFGCGEGIELGWDVKSEKWALLSALRVRMPGVTRFIHSSCAEQIPELKEQINNILLH